MYQVGDTLVVTKTEPLEGKDVAPKLELGAEMEVKGYCLDSKGNQHLDMGLRTTLNYITSYETGEELPKNTIKNLGEPTKIVHWCHPSRFKLKEE